MNLPQELKYTNTHEWIRPEDDGVVIGITDYAQSELSDLTFIELPSVGDEFKAGEEAGVLESVKAASDIYAPVTGEVIEVNEALNDNPELINSDPFTEGWLFKMSLQDSGELDDLLSPDDYEELLPE